MLITKIVFLLIAGLTFLFPFNSNCQVIGTDGEGTVYDVSDHIKVRTTFLLSEAGRPYDFKILEVSPVEILQEVDSTVLLAKASNDILRLPKEELTKWTFDQSTNRHVGSILISRESLGLK